MLVSLTHPELGPFTVDLIKTNPSRWEGSTNMQILKWVFTVELLLQVR